MAAPAWNKAVPTLANTLSSDVDGMRDEFQMAMMGIAMGLGPLESGWTLVINGSVSQPSSREWTHSDGRKIKFSYAYSSGAITKVILQYDRGLGGNYETVVAWNETVDANGYVTGGSTTAS